MQDCMIKSNWLQMDTFWAHFCVIFNLHLSRGFWLWLSNIWSFFWKSFQKSIFLSKSGMASGSKMMNEFFNDKFKYMFFLDNFSCVFFWSPALSWIGFLKKKLKKRVYSGNQVKYALSVLWNFMFFCLKQGHNQVKSSKAIHAFFRPNLDHVGTSTRAECSWIVICDVDFDEQNLVLHHFQFSSIFFLKRDGITFHWLR